MGQPWFQRPPHITLSGACWQICVVFLYDIIVFSRSFKEHIHHLNKALALLQCTEISLKLRECNFAQLRADYFGLLICPENLAMAQQIIDAIKFEQSLTHVWFFFDASNV